jgi:hypothetical protein
VIATISNWISQFNEFATKQLLSALARIRRAVSGDSDVGMVNETEVTILVNFNTPFTFSNVPWDEQFKDDQLNFEPRAIARNDNIKQLATDAMNRSSGDH